MTHADDSDPSVGRGWKAFFLALGSLIGASLVWGWLRPEPEGDADVPPAVTTAEPPLATDAVAVAVPVADPSVGPAWVRPTIRWTLRLIVGIVAGLALLVALRDVVSYVLLALFFSFALEPAVGYLHAQRGWRRGSATGALVAIVFVLLVLVILVFVPTVLKGAAALAQRLPEVAADVDAAADEVGVDVSTTSVATGGEEAAASLAGAAETPMSVVFGFTSSLVGGIFGFFTVVTFTYYMVAQGPQFRRAVLSLFPRHRQEELLTVWEAAIEKTGGYFYSRLLLAVINGSLSWVVLRASGVPGAAALAMFQGAVAAFIPIVGTYIAGVVPTVAALATVGPAAAIAYLVYVLVYQQIENYLLSPRLQAKTMRLHPAVAFGAALAGGALGGLLWAFLALPFAATLQASASLWFQQHEVVESDLTHVEVAPAAPAASLPADEPHPDGTVRRALSATRGWLRKLT
jgi:predicted PurR-regulated permease PerM